MWFNRSENDLKGAIKARVDGRLAELAKALPGSAPEVLQALVGTKESWIDITRLARRHVKGTRLRLTAGDLGLKADPKENKALILFYRYPDPPAREPGQKIKVQFALWGAHNSWKDFASRIQPWVKGGRLRLKVAEAKLPDTAVGKGKTLIVFYRVGSKHFLALAPEGGAISVP